MKYPQILRTLKGEPLLIVGPAHASLISLFEDHATKPREEFKAEREGTGSCGEKVALEQMEIVDGIAHIPIGGPIGIRLGSFEKGAGAVDVGDITRELDEAEASDEVSAILFDIDSPGGMVTGTPEVADRIKRLTKPTYAFTNGTIASAAYWIACATDGIFATKSADIGSIGVYIPWLNSVEYYKGKGYKVELFTSGKYKGMGFPGTDLTAEQKEHINESVADIAEMFYSHVKSCRGQHIGDETMQGQTFRAPKAMERGLIDYIVRDKAEAASFLR